MSGRAGARTAFITIEERTPGTGPQGNPLDTWQKVVDDWANIKVLSGSAAIKAGVDAETVKVSMRILWRTGLDGGMRVRHDGTIYKITAVLPDLARRQHVDLVCEVTG